MKSADNMNWKCYNRLTNQSKRSRILTSDGDQSNQSEEYLPVCLSIHLSSLPFTTGEMPKVTTQDIPAHTLKNIIVL